MSLAADLEQAMDEDTEPQPATVDFHGTAFRVRDKVPVWALMEFLDGEGRGEAEALAAGHRFIRDVLHPDDFAAFGRACREHDASFDEILQLAVAAATARPTVRPADSPDGPPTSGASSAPGLLSRPAGWPATIPAPPPDLRPVPDLPE